MIFGKNRAFLYPTKVLADTNIYHYYTPFMMLKSKWSEAKMLDKLTY